MAGQENGRGKFSGFALTEPQVGSDAAAGRTTAKKDGDSYILNGRKLLYYQWRCGRDLLMASMRIKWGFVVPEPATWFLTTVVFR